MQRKIPGTPRNRKPDPAADYQPDLWAPPAPPAAAAQAGPRRDPRESGQLVNTTKFRSGVAPQRLSCASELAPGRGGTAGHPLPAGAGGQPATPHTLPPGQGVDPAAAARRIDRRASRYQLRDDYQAWTDHRRAQWCGRRRLPGRDPQVRVQDAVAHFAQVQLCGAVWCCPVCAPRIRQLRAAEVSHALGWWMRQHGAGSVALLTLTVRHGRHHHLADLVPTVRAGFRALTAGRFAKQLRADYGLVHHIKGWDATFGPNGPHPHLHVVLLLDAPLSDARIDALRRAIYAQWSRTVVARGLDAPTEQYGAHLDVARDVRRLSRYVGQVTSGEGDDDDTAAMEAGALAVAQEVARADLKAARREGHRSYWQLLADACRPLCDADGVLDEAVEADRDLWREWERATAGITALRWSPGLRAAVQLGAEVTDEQAVAVEVGGVTVYTFADHLDWQRVCRLRGARQAVLVAAEVGSTAGVEALLAHIRASGHLPRRVVDVVPAAAAAGPAAALPPAVVAAAAAVAVVANPGQPLPAAARRDAVPPQPRPHHHHHNPARYAAQQPPAPPPCEGDGEPAHHHRAAAAVVAAMARAAAAA